MNPLHTKLSTEMLKGRIRELERQARITQQNYKENRYGGRAGRAIDRQHLARIKSEAQEIMAEIKARGISTSITDILKEKGA